MAAIRRRPLALAAAVAVALGASAFAVNTASAAEVPLSGYELTWGIKQSYRSYVTGAWAQGSFTATDGASQAADNGVFTFTDGQGTYDSTSHTLHLSFQGTLTAKSTAHGFVREMSDFQYDSAAGTLTADLVSDGGEKRQDVTLATVAAPTSQDMTGLATTLTAAAGEFLGSSSYANAAGDPLSVVQKTPESPSPTGTASNSSSPTPSSTESATGSASPTTTASPTATSSSSASASASESASPSASASETAPATKGDIADGALVWGVKESFRAYVVGSVANGKITASDGATQAADNGVFTFADATGTYDTDADTLSAAFKGSVNFKGHEDNGTYGLDLTLSDLKAELDGGSGELTADVDSLGEKSDDVVLAHLKAGSGELTVNDDVIALEDVTATLTDAGAEAFGGFYTAGTELDPVDLSVALSEDAQLPGDDDESGSGGSGDSGDSAGSGTSGTTGGTGTTGSTTGGVSGALASTGSSVPAGAVGTAGAVAVAAGAGVVYAMRRRRTEGA